MTASACPPAERLRQFRLGLLPDADAGPVEQHLARCPSCLGRLPALAADDPLVQGLRAQRTRPRLNNPLLAAVVQEVRARPFRPAGDQSTPSGQLTDATVAIPAGNPAVAEALQAFLTPPKGPGEVGWLGAFRVLSVLGEGGMGLVLLGEDTRLQRRVALKVMKPMLAVDPSARGRFLREARATAALEHEHIIAIHHIDEANGIPYLAMPLLQGETLEDRLRREPRLPLGEVLRIGRQTAEALAAAHAKGLIHRDIKPGNLWLEAPSGRIKVLDFGLAAMPCPEGEKTLPGVILGTPGYMAPEQSEGQADHRSDLFSLGCVLYRMATGQLPFKGQTLTEKLRSTLFDNPQPPQQLNPALPAPLCNLVQRLLAKNPAERPAPAQAVARVLQTLETQPARPAPVPVAIPVASVASQDATVPVAGVAIPVAPVPPSATPLARALPRLGRRGLVLVLGGAAAAVLLLLLVVVAFWLRHAGDGGSGRPGDSEEAISGRRRVVPVKRPAPEASGPVLEVVPDRTFPETWVQKSEPIERVKAWTIETNDIGQYYPVAFDFTDDEKMLIRYGTPNANWTHRFWMQFDPATCGLVGAPFGGSYDALSRDARICARSVAGGVQLWEQGGAKEWITLRSPGQTYTAAFSPDGKVIATISICAPDQNFAVRGIAFWDARGGDKFADCSLTDYSITRTVLGWSPDSKTLAVSTTNNGVALIRAPWKEAVRTIARPAAVTALSWSPDGTYLATVEGDNQVRLVNVVRDEPALDVPDSKTAYPALVPAWSPDGKELAFATADRKVIVYNLEQKKVTFRFAGHTRPINAVAFFGDGRTLVSGSNGSVRFWDLEKNGLRGTLLNLAGQGWLAIAPDGNYRCSTNGEARFVMKARDESNRLHDFSPEEFHKTYGWQNHPERVKLTGD